MSGSTSIGAGPLASPSPRKRGVAKSVKAAGVWLIFATVAFSTLYPLFFLASTAVRPEEDYARNAAALPSNLTFDNIDGAFEMAHLAQYGLNSLLVVVPAVILLMVLATLGAYALSSFDFALRGVFLGLVVIMLAIPPTILVVPIFKAIKDADLLNNRLGLILVYTALAMPFSIFLLASFMRLIPKELHHAAKVDGAGALRTLWSVVVPLVRPALLTLVTLNFLFMWNEFLFSLVLLQDEAQRTIMVGIAGTQSALVKNTGIVAAGLLFSMIPPLLIFTFFQRSLTRGLTAGAVK